MPDRPLSSQSARVCECGHPVSAHELIDHDKNPGDADRRREMQVARWHLVCTADTRPEGQAESPWDHVCGCIANVWEPEDGVRMIAPDTSPAMRFMLRGLFARNGSGRHMDGPTGTRFLSKGSAEPTAGDDR